ncbi:MAG: FemAB family PEP-CTERM system-associated protein [Alphaproteobacteria bacterium]|nr:FemAB family PEP-CTERM system-associated protein [Alphaproteobacteria bacterium]MBV9377840.1 FemAB family PEP-CTERM system-associated protein [Alphaproteobacteria bacterium]MBV9816306.1 FemAB family PEP-CTERM system-associated protein [Alphaproteobacteria bacterium]
MFRPGDEQRWDEFVLAHPGGTFFHLAGWKRVIERAFRHPTHYLVSERSGIVTGVLPLTHVKSLLFGSSLISNAFAVHGGPIAADDDSLRALEGEAVRLMGVLGVPVLEFRDFSAARSDWPSKRGLYAIFRRELAPTVERNMMAIPRKQRAMVRKGIRHELRSEIDDGIDRLYRVYAESVRNLGTPVFAKSYFSILREEFSSTSDVITVSCDGKAIASVLNFYFRDEVLPFYGGGVAAARQLAANDFMYWEVMRRACERGYRVFDFGRSKVGTGSYAFKCNWGFDPTPLTYQFRLAGGRSIPDLNPLNPKLAMLVAAWKRLPLAVATRLGPLIVKGIG